MEEKFHKVKLIRFQGRSVPILLQNEDGPCALVAICNILLLKNIFVLKPDVSEISQIDLLNLLGDELMYSEMDVEEQQQKINFAMNMLPKLTTGIVFNLRFKGITDFEATREFAPFSVLGIPVYHGWIVDPEDSETYNAVGSKSYDSIMLDIATSEAGTVVNEDKKRPGKDSVNIFAATTATIGVPSPGLSKELIKDFFMVKSANQLTVYGLSCLRNQLKEHELCVLFRNNHFNTMFKFGGQIYLLLTNEAYIDKPDLVWEMLNRVDGNTTLVNGSFEEVKEHVASFNDAAQDNSASLSDLTLEWALQKQELVSGASRLVKGPQALPVIQSKSRKLIKMEREAIERLISSVSDDDEEFKNFWATIPSVDDMVKENFPLDNFPRPTMAWCRNNLTRISGERKDAGQQGCEVKNAWSNLFWDGVLNGEQTEFSEFSNSKRNELIDIMLDDILRSKVTLSYRKWKYAYWKEKIHDFRDREPVGGKEDDVTDSEEFKIGMVQVEIKRLIRSVEDDDDEFKKFSVTIPSVDIMVKEKFPLLNFRRCTIAWCCKKLTSRSISESKKDAAESGKEWVNAWNNLYHNGMLKNKRDFSKYTEKEQENHIDQMLSDIEESKRNLSYRKWKFALKKQDSESVGAEKEEDLTGSSDELKIKMQEEEIREMIRGVKDDDEEFKKFFVNLPSVDEIVKENIPLIGFNRRTILWYCKNLTSFSDSKRDAAESGKEWVNAWNNLYHNGVLDAKRQSFSMYSKEEQENCISQMSVDIEESKMKLRYKKFKFALENKGHDFRDQKSVGGEKEGDVTRSSQEFKEPIATINDAALDKSVSQKLNLALKDMHDFQDRELVGGEGSNVTRNFEEFKEPIASISVAAHDISISNLMSFGFSPIFPQFQDKDAVQLYNKPFSLKHWLDSHISDKSRWCHIVENVDGLDLKLWYGDRPKRESLAIMQSILSAVLDYHCRTGRPLGNLGEHSKIFLSQYTHSFLGFQQIRFRITFPEPLELEDNLLVSLAKDMEDVRKIFLRILQGRDLNPELNYLLSDLLQTYPFPKHMEWKTQLLQNYTGLWDGKLRRCFMILFFYTLACEVEMKDKQKIYAVVNGCVSILKCKNITRYRWLDKIPENDSVFYNILTYTPSKQDRKTVGPAAPTAPAPPPPPPPPPTPQYEDCMVESAIKYYRDCLHHNRDARCSLSLNDLEVCLTNLFPGLVFASYVAMCKKKIFLG